MFHTTCEPALMDNPIDDVIGSSIHYAALVVAGKLGLFSALEDGSLSARELARALNAAPHGVEALADVLVAAGYLSVEGGAYQRSALADRWFGASAHQDFTPALLWGYELWNVLWDLPDTIRQGKPRKSLWQRWAEHPAAAADFSAYMKLKSALTLSAVVEALPMPEGAARMLDLGGSHGLHSIALCRAYPQLHATIMDLPEALAKTPAAIREAGMKQRVQAVAGDFLADDLGEQYDVALLFEILHNHTPEHNEELLSKVAKALGPGGRIVILEDVRGDTVDEHNAAFSLAMFACSGDRTYSFPEISRWLERGGFVDVEQIPLPSSVSLVVATRA